MLVNVKTHDRETKQDLFLTAGASVWDNTMRKIDQAVYVF